MRNTIVVSGTATAIGKTFVAAELIRSLRAGGSRIHARKPVQSFDAGDERTDADVLGAASGESPFDVCPPHRRYPVAMAPPMAARALGRAPITISDLVAELRVTDADLTVVEGVGGPRSPLADDGDTVTLAAALGGRAVVLVSHAGLGALNDVLLGVDAFAPRPIAVFLNRFDSADDLHARNLEWLRDRERLDVATTIEDLALLVGGVRPRVRSRAQEVP